MNTDSKKNKNQMREEINSMVHIGRTANDIEEALSMVGYNQSVLKEVLTNQFMEELMQKEHGFVIMEQAEKKSSSQKSSSKH